MQHGETAVKRTGPPATGAVGPLRILATRTTFGTATPTGSNTKQARLTRLYHPPQVCPPQL